MIIDASTAIANKDFVQDPDTEYGFFYKELTFHSEGSDMIDYTLETFPWASYHNLTVKDTPELPSKHHYFLICPIIPGFALNDKTWSKSLVFRQSQLRVWPHKIKILPITAIFGIWIKVI